MIPILHNSRYGGTANTIIGRLSNCISCEVTEELNGQYELEIEYVTDGTNAKELKTGRVILAQADDRFTNVQPFRIYNVRTDVTGRIVVNAHHISYDLNKMVINPFTATGISNVISAIPSNIEKRSIDVLPWAFQSNLTNTTSVIDLKYPKNLRSFLGGSEGSLLDVFGGEFEWDGFTVKLNSSRGQYRGVQIRYGVNLIDLEKNEQYDDTYTHVMCYYYDQENDVNVQMQNAIAVSDLSEHEADVVQSRTKLIDVTDKFQDSVPTENDLRNLAVAYANKMSASPSVGVDVEFVDLRSTGEDTGVDAVVRLGDTVNVVYNPLDISEVRKIVKTTWNVLAERYDKLVIGKPEASLGQTISEFSSGDATGYSGGGGGSSVLSVNGHTGDVVLTYRDVGALASTTIIPSKTSQLTNDSGYITSSAVPTKTSQLTNDSGYITSASGLVTDPNYVHTDNNYTTAEKNKLSGIEEGAEVNAIDDVTINKSSVVANKIANIPYAGANQFGVIAIETASEPGSSYAKISYDDPNHPSGQASHSKDVYLPLMPSVSSPFPYWYLPSATHSQKGAVTLTRWTGSITDNIDEGAAEGYDATVGGIARTVTTDSGDFQLVAGNRVVIDNMDMWGYTTNYPHFINVDNTGYKELRYTPSQQVRSTKYGVILSGTIEVVYNGTYFIIVNGYSYKMPTTPAASSNEYGTIKMTYNTDARQQILAFTGSNQTPYYAPALGTSGGTILPRYMPSATSTTQGAVIVDSAMSDTSTNPVQNSTVKAYIDGHSGGLPSVSSSDDGKVLRVVDGAWAAVSLPSASGVSF